MGNVLLARMGEVTLKGLNRGSFEIQLKSNLKYRLKKFGNLKIYQSQSRIWIEPKDEDNPNFQSMASAEDISYLHHFPVVGTPRSQALMPVDQQVVLPVVPPIHLQRMLSGRSKS